MAYVLWFVISNVIVKGLQLLPSFTSQNCGIPLEGKSRLDFVHVLENTKYSNEVGLLDNLSKSQVEIFSVVEPPFLQNSLFSLFLYDDLEENGCKLHTRHGWLNEYIEGLNSFELSDGEDYKNEITSCMFRARYSEGLAPDPQSLKILFVTSASDWRAVNGSDEFSTPNLSPEALGDSLKSSDIYFGILANLDHAESWKEFVTRLNYPRVFLELFDVSTATMEGLLHSALENVLCNTTNLSPHHEIYTPVSLGIPENVLSRIPPLDEMPFLPGWPSCGCGCGCGCGGCCGVS